MTVFQTSIEIKAPKERIFQVLCDTQNYPVWHPGMKKITGELALGKSVDLYLSNRKKSSAVRVPVVVTVLDENKKLEWQGSLFARGPLRKYFLVRHAFYIEEMGDGLCQFTNEEEFYSVFSWPAKKLQASFLQGYRDVNVALKNYCEA